MAYFSIIIPVYNRPQEVKELLGSLAVQTCKDFEVIIVEDGSQERSEQVVTSYGDLLDVKYFYKENSGPGLSRNYGANCAGGVYLLFLDSDCIVPPEYIAVIKQACRTKKIDAFGGPDRAHHSFTSIQKAINYSMTSFSPPAAYGDKKKPWKSSIPVVSTWDFQKRF